MTLALYGKSNRRRTLLIVLAIMAVLGATASGAVLRPSGHADAATNTLAPSTASCLNSSGTIDDNGACTATAALLTNADASVAHVETDDSGAATGFDDVTVTFDLSGITSSTINSAALHLTSVLEPAAAPALVRVGSIAGVTNYGASAAPGIAVSYTNTTFRNAIAANEGGTITVHISVDCNPDANDCGITLDKVDLVVDATPLPNLTVSKNNDVGGSVTQGGAFNWTVTIGNNGAATASFSSGTVILTDTLPQGASFGSPVYASSVTVVKTGTTGNMTCGATPNIVCTASGTFTIPVGATVVVTIPVTSAGTAASLANPKPGQQCSVDTGLTITETTESDNTCSNTVTIVPPSPDMQVQKSDSVANSVNAQGTFNWLFHIVNKGTATASYTTDATILTDDLPGGASYSTPANATPSGSATGTVGCAISGSATKTLTCKASGPVSIPVNAAFDVSLPVDLNSDTSGNVSNPRSGGACAISAPIQTESDASNNNCNTDEVVIVAASARDNCHNGDYSACVSLLHTGNPQTPPANQCFGIDANFVIDTSGSIGDTNIGNLKTGLGSFVDTLGSSSVYSASRFAGDATMLTAGYVDGATFNTNISGISSGGRTWTQGGIVAGEGNTANDNGSRPNVMFIVTDGNPNVSIGGTENSLSDPLTWLDAANAAIDEANTARGNFWIRAVLLGSGDSNLPFGPNNAAWQAAVMTALGGGSYIQQVDWAQTAQGLLASTGCQPAIVKSHTVPVGNGIGGSVDAGKSFTWTITVTVPSELGQTTTISDALPSGFSYTAIADSASGGGDDTKMSCTPARGTAFTCTLVQHAPAGTYTINVTTTAPAANLQTNCNAYTNTATIKYGSLDLSPATDKVTVEHCSAPDLTVTKTPSVSDVILGQNPPATFTWTLVVTNTGGQAMFTNGQAILTDTLPAGATYVLNTNSPTVSGGSPAGSGGAACSYNSGTRVLTCNAGASGATFGNGSTLTVTLTATPTTAGDLVNSASTCKVDPTPVIAETNEDNNTCTSTVHVHDPSPITVVKAAGTLTGNTASWTISIDNTGTYAIDRAVVITDAGATFSGSAQVTGGHGSTCSPSALPTTCTVKAGDTVVITATKDATSIHQTCAGGTINNQASYTIDGGSSQNTANPGITVPGDNGQCDRTITVCKQVTQNSDGIADDLASLTFGVSGNTKLGQPTSVSVSNITEGGVSRCVDITALRKDTVTFSEPTSAPLGTGWTLTGITGESSFSLGSRTATVNADTSDNPAAVTVTFTNKHAFATKSITVCKAFEANADGVVDTFTFTATVTESGTNVIHGPDSLTFSNVAEGATPCQDLTVAAGATFRASSIVEGAMPNGWNGNAQGYPDVTDDGGAHNHFTIHNKELDRVRTITLCKEINFVDDGVDESGAFSFDVTWSGGNRTETRTATEGAAATCADVINLPQGKDITFTEQAGRPANWGADQPGFPTNDGTGNGSSGHAIGVVAAGSNTATVTFTNQPVLQTRNIYVCKNVLATADGIDDGGAFSFTLSWATSPSGTHSETITRTAFENSGLTHVTTDCGGVAGVALAIQVPKGKDVAVSETSDRPTTPLDWGGTAGDATGFPKVKHAGGSYASGSSLTSTANSVDDELDFQNSHTFRSRSLQVCKTVVATDDGIDNGGDFVFGISWNTGSANDLTITVAEGATKCATVDGLPSGYEITVTEKANRPATWGTDDAGYPQVSGATSGNGTGSVAKVAGAATTPTVTFTNKPTFQTRDLFVCKYIAANADGINDDGTFNFSVRWTNSDNSAYTDPITRTVWEHADQNPAHIQKDCGGEAGVAVAIKVPLGKDVTVTETSGPWAAGDNASGFPKGDKGATPPFATNVATTSLMSLKNTVGDYLDFQNKRADHQRTLQICKLVDANVDGVNDGGDFAFSVTDSLNDVVGSATRTAWEVAGGGKATTDCGIGTVTILQGKAYTIAETAQPAGWSDAATYPKNDAAVTNTFVAGASGTVPAGTGDVTVTFRNKTPDQYMDVQVCKVVASNNDNVVDGGDFQFTISQAAAQDQTFTLNKTETGGTTPCATKQVLKNVPWTVFELDGRPGDQGLTGTWHGDDPAYPQNDKAGAGKHASASMAATDTSVTFTNKTLDRTHSLQVCKMVDDNGDGDSGDGGTFHFTVAGGSPEPAQFDLTVDEGATKCQDVTVLDGFHQTVSESEPQAWHDAAGFPKWGVVGTGSNGPLALNGTGLTTGEIDGSASKVTFENKALTPQKVTFIKAVCDSFSVVPANQPVNGSFEPNDLPAGFDQDDLGGASPAAGEAVGATLPAGCASAAGWTFELSDNSQAALGTVTTGANGTTIELNDAQVAAALNGGITVKEETQNGYTFAGLKCYTAHTLLDNSELLSLPGIDSQSISGVNCIAYNVQDGAISGHKYEDVDGDGAHQDGEPGLKGWTITATRDSGAPLFTTTTGDDGSYSFDGVPQGTYHVCETPQNGWTNTAPLCHDVSVGGGAADATGVDFENFADAAIVNVKRVDNDSGDRTDFTASIGGPETFTSTAFHQTVASEDIVHHGGAYTAVEDAAGADFQYLGTAVAVDGECPQGVPNSASTSGATGTLHSGEKLVFCHYNREVGTVVLVKRETHQSAGAETWNFTSAALGNPSLTTGANDENPPSVSSNQQTFTNVPVGTYSIAELQGRGVCTGGSPSTDYQTNALAAVGSVPNPDPAANVVGASNLSFNVQPGEVTTIVFENQGCGTVLATSSLAVRKFSDPNATFSGTAALSGWVFTVTGTTNLGAPLTRTLATTGGVALFVDLPDGNYTVTETPQAGWSVVGSKYNGATQPGLSRDITIALEEDKEIDFYNRALVSVRVTKTEVASGTTNPGAGWAITITGCGFSATQPTDADGSVTFSNLQPCSYTVSENAASKAGYLPSGPTSVTANALAAGQQVTVHFTNVRNDVCTTCGNPGSSPTATPTTPPTATPTSGTKPTAAPTNPPTSTPTPIEETRGEKTPGPGQTPVAPNTGNGFFGGGAAGTNLGLGLCGLLAVALGTLALAAGRRRRRR